MKHLSLSCCLDFITGPKITLFCVSMLFDKQLPDLGGHFLRGTRRRLLFQIGLQIQRAPKIDKGLSVVSEEKDGFRQKPGPVLISEERVKKGCPFFLGGFFVENQLGHKIDGPLHTSLGFNEKLQGLLLRMDEMPCKSLGIHETEKRRGPLPNGLAKKPGFVRVWKLPVLLKR